MNELDISTHDYLRPPLWSGGFVLGKLAINVSVRGDKSFERQYSLPRVCNRLMLLRRERGISRRELADTLNMSYSTLEALERGSYIPSLELTFRISVFFDMPIEAIFSYV